MKIESGDIIVVRRFRGTDDYALYTVEHAFPNAFCLVGFSYFDVDSAHSIIAPEEIESILSHDDRIACARQLFEVAQSMVEWTLRVRFINTTLGNVFFERPPNLLTICLVASRFLDKTNEHVSRA